MLKINTVKLREDLKTTAEELRALKGILRESGQPRVTWRTHASLGSLKAKATKLYSLRAHARSRLHRPSVLDSAAQGAYIADLLQQYALEAQRTSSESNDLAGCGFESRRAQVQIAL